MKWAAWSMILLMISVVVAQPVAFGPDGEMEEQQFTVTDYENLSPDARTYDHFLLLEGDHRNQDLFSKLSADQQLQFFTRSSYQQDDCEECAAAFFSEPGNARLASTAARQYLTSDLFTVDAPPPPDLLEVYLDTVVSAEYNMQDGNARLVDVNGVLFLDNDGGRIPLKGLTQNYVVTSLPDEKGFDLRIKGLESGVRISGQVDGDAPGVAFEGSSLILPIKGKPTRVDLKTCTAAAKCAVELYSTGDIKSLLFEKPITVQSGHQRYKLTPKLNVRQQIGRAGYDLTEGAKNVLEDHTGIDLPRQDFHETFGDDVPAVFFSPSGSIKGDTILGRDVNIEIVNADGSTRLVTFAEFAEVKSTVAEDGTRTETVTTSADERSFTSVEQPDDTTVTFDPRGNVGRVIVDDLPQQTEAALHDLRAAQAEQPDTPLATLSPTGDTPSTMAGPGTLAVTTGEEEEEKTTAVTVLQSGDGVAVEAKKDDSGKPTVYVDVQAAASDDTPAASVDEKPRDVALISRKTGGYIKGSKGYFPPVIDEESLFEPSSPVQEDEAPVMKIKETGGEVSISLSQRGEETPVESGERVTGEGVHDVVVLAVADEVSTLPVEEDVTIDPVDDRPSVEPLPILPGPSPDLDTDPVPDPDPVTPVVPVPSPEPVPEPIPEPPSEEQPPETPPDTGVELEDDGSGYSLGKKIAIGVGVCVGVALCLLGGKAAAGLIGITEGAGTVAGFIGSGAAGALAGTTAAGLLEGAGAAGALGAGGAGALGAGAGVAGLLTETAGVGIPSVVGGGAAGALAGNALRLAIDAAAGAATAAILSDDDPDVIVATGVSRPDAASPSLSDRVRDGRGLGAPESEVGSPSTEPHGGTVLPGTIFPTGPGLTPDGTDQTDQSGPYIADLLPPKTLSVEDNVARLRRLGLLGGNRLVKQEFITEAYNNRQTRGQEKGQLLQAYFEERKKQNYANNNVLQSDARIAAARAISGQETNANVAAYVKEVVEGNPGKSQRLAYLQDKIDRLENTISRYEEGSAIRRSYGRVIQRAKDELKTLAS